jgi:uncharacterized protein involved in exopolysaccharide biosynthesis
MAAPDDGEEWRFSLEDLEEDETGENGDSEESNGNVAGTLRPDRPVEPGRINAENAFFVLVGALVAGLFVGAVLSLAL